MTEVAESVNESTGSPHPYAPPDEPLDVPMWQWIAVALAAILSVALTVRNGFVYSDHSLIAQNSLLWNGHGLLLIWTSIFPTPAAYQFDYYAPISWSLLSFEWRIFRSWAGGYHAVSLIIHLATSLMVIQLLRKLAVGGAGLVGLLFAAHPVLLGATAWLTLQPFLLGTLLSLAALYVALRWMGLTRSTLEALPAESNRLFVLMIILIVVASLAHPIGGLIPLAALLISWWKRGTVDSQQMSSLAPMVLLGIAIIWLFLYMQSRILSSATLAELDFGTTPLAELFARLQIACYSLLVHAGKLIVPYPLSFDYGWRTPGRTTLIALVAVAGLAGLIFSQKQKIGRGVLTAIGLYALLLLPFLGIFNIERMRYSFVRDGEVYAAAVPGLVLFVLILIRILKSEKSASAVVAVMALLFVGLSMLRAGDFKDNQTLWSRTLARHPKSLLAELEQARSIGASNLKLMRAHLDRALAINPKNLDAKILDAVYPADNKIATSLKQIGTLVNQYPSYAPLTFATGQQFEIAARFYEDAGKQDEYGLAMGQAFEFYADTVRSDPGHIPARVKVGQLLVRASLITPNPAESLSKAQEAVATLQQAVDMNPNRIESRLVFAKALYDIGLTSSAAEREVIFGRAAENLFVVDTFEPGNAEVAFYTGLMHQKSNFTEQALIAFHQAQEKRPEWTKPMFALAEVYYQREELDKAREWLDRAMAIEPDNPFFKRLEEKIESATTQPVGEIPTTSPAQDESTP